MYYVHPTAGERFYLRTLLTCVKGATSFEDLRTLPGQDQPCATYREACLGRGLLEDDSEWKKCLEEASQMATGRQLRNLFVTILRDCTPSDPCTLWLQFHTEICNNLCYTLQA